MLDTIAQPSRTVLANMLATNYEWLPLNNLNLNNNKIQNPVTQAN